MMLELDKKVFGNIMTREIIGAEPPLEPDTKEIFEKEFSILTKELESKSQTELARILEEQTNARDHVNSRPGAMALAQDKIQLFNEYNEKYIKTIENIINS